MICYFLRHGQSQANAEGVLAGQLDSPLTKLGRHQALSEGERLREEELTFDVIITSPLVRAYDTAVAIAQALEYPLGDLVTDPRLMERHVGDLEGEPAALLADAIVHQTMNVETTDVLRARCQAVLDDIVTRYGDQTVLLVAHAGVGEVMRAIVDETTDGISSGLSIPNAQVFRLL